MKLDIIVSGKPYYASIYVNMDDTCELAGGFSSFPLFLFCEQPRNRAVIRQVTNEAKSPNDRRLRSTGTSRTGRYVGMISW